MKKRAPSYWLMKSEPDVYAIDDLAREGVGTWEGVRNYQARNFMRAMQEGDLALFYHSSTTPPGVVGLMRIARTAYVDPTQFDPKSPYFDAASKPDAPRWERVDVAFVEKVPRQVTLDQLKADPAFAEMLVIRRGMRLSVQPVDARHFARILKHAGASTRVTGAKTSPATPAVAAKPAEKPVARVPSSKSAQSAKPAAPVAKKPRAR